MRSTEAASRREFLKSSSIIVAGASLAGGLSVARSAHAAGSDVIKLALIGAGGRGVGAASQLMTADKNLQLIAIADAFDKRANDAMTRLKKQFGDQVTATPDRVFTGLKAYEKAIATDADLVVLATPPGFRPLQYQAAVEAGKHVFMEKPCCVDAPGYRTLMEANKLADEKEPAGRRRPAAPASAELHRDHPADPRRRDRRHHHLARLLERRRHLEPRPRGRDDRDAVPGPQLVPLLLAQRRQHRRAAHPQPRHRQLGQGRPAPGRGQRHGRLHGAATWGRTRAPARSSTTTSSSSPTPTARRCSASAAT